MANGPNAKLTGDPTALIQLAIANRAKVGSGAPSGDNATGFYIRLDAPFAGTVYYNGASLSNSYTWAGRPTPSADNLGAIITITDWDADVICREIESGYYWVPYGGPIVVHNPTKAGDSSSCSNASASFQECTSAAWTAPSGLGFPGATIEMQLRTRRSTLAVHGFNSYRPQVLFGSNNIGGPAGNVDTGLWRIKPIGFNRGTGSGSNFQWMVGATGAADNESSTTASPDYAFDDVTQVRFGCLWGGGAGSGPNDGTVTAVFEHIRVIWG